MSHLRSKWLVSLKLLLVISVLVSCNSYKGSQEFLPPSIDNIQSAYREAGLSDIEAASILLSRFTYGARPGDVEKVVNMGVAKWFAGQLRANHEESLVLTQSLAKYQALNYSHQQLAAKYPSFSSAIAHIRRFHPGVLPSRDDPVIDFSVISSGLVKFAKKHDMQKVDSGLLPQLYGQKILRSVYSENQLQTVMVDFWQNYFSLGVRNFGAKPWIMPFEQDVLYPNALNQFPALLEQTIKHPVILEAFKRQAKASQLDPGLNLMSQYISAHPQKDTLQNLELKSAKEAIVKFEHEADLILRREFWAKTGRNKVLASTILKKYTLGEFESLTPKDIDGVADILTGWTAFPMGASNKWFAFDIKATESFGFVRQGSFWFRADQHDARGKTVLDKKFPAGKGLSEGEELLNWLSMHPATAKHLSKKLVERFVGGTSDTAGLNQKLEKTFIATGGSINSMLLSLVSSAEFWSAASKNKKLKTPFEYVVSALRAKQAKIQSNNYLALWLARLGQPLYGYIDISGFPQDGKGWLDTASLLERLNFSTQLQNNSIDGVSVLPVERAGSVTRQKQASGAQDIALPEFQYH